MTRKGKAGAAVKQRSTSGRKATGRPFKKGKSGNPKGRPRTGLAAAEIVRAVGAETVGRATRLEVIVRRLFKAASAGDVHAATVLFDRGFGKPTQPVDLEYAPKQRLIIEVVEIAKPLPADPP